MEVSRPGGPRPRLCPCCLAPIAAFSASRLDSVQGRNWLARHADITDLARDVLPATDLPFVARFAIGECASCGHAYYLADVLACPDGPELLARCVAGLVDIEAAEFRDVVAGDNQPGWIHVRFETDEGVLHQHLVGPFEVDVVSIAPTPALPDNGLAAIAHVLEHTRSVIQARWRGITQLLQAQPATRECP